MWGARSRAERTVERWCWGFASNKYKAGKVMWVSLGGKRRGEKLDKNFGRLSFMWETGNEHLEPMLRRNTQEKG